MTNDSDDAVGCDDLAPTQRLHIIAELLAVAVHRCRDDARRAGEGHQHSESITQPLELSEPVRLDRPTG